MLAGSYADFKSYTDITNMQKMLTKTRSLTYNQHFVMRWFYAPSIKHIGPMLIWAKLLLLLLLIGCDRKDANDCIQSAGNTISQEVPVVAFNRILVEQGLNMVLIQDSVPKVVVQTGENLIPDIKVQVVDKQLQLRNENDCNFFREYGLTTIYVSSPNVSEIRSSTQGEIRSEGTFKVDKLKVYSENFRNNEYLTSGEFYLDVDTKEFQLIFNGVSNMFIHGRTEQLNITMASGNGRFEGKDFTVENADIYHRSSNDVIVNVVGLLKADLYGTGDLIAVKRPATEEVTEHYKGKYIVQ